MNFRWLAFQLLLLFAGHAFAAEIYKWVDQDGKVHYSDAKPPDAQAEEIRVEKPEVSDPDEGELRRRRLLEQADIDAARRVEEKRTEKAAREVQQQALEVAQQACLKARIRLEILGEQLPVYADSEGNLRASWEFDTYKGPRQYIDDANRSTALAQAKQAVEDNCDKPYDRQAQANARRIWIYSERCSAAKADLEALQRPRAKAPKDSIEAQRQLVDRYCSNP